MKTYLTLLFLTALSLRAELEFSGFFLTPKEAMFSLTETPRGESSGWLKVGQSFRGYTVASFDQAHEVVSLGKDGQFVELHLKEAKAKDGKMTISGYVDFGPGNRAEGIRATLFLGEETVFPAEGGVALHVKAECRPDGNIQYSARFGRDKDGAVMALPTTIARLGQSFSIRCGELGYSFKP